MVARQPVSACKPARTLCPAPRWSRRLQSMEHSSRRQHRGQHPLSQQRRHCPARRSHPASGYQNDPVGPVGCRRTRAHRDLDRKRVGNAARTPGSSSGQLGPPTAGDGSRQPSFLCVGLSRRPPRYASFQPRPRQRPCGRAGPGRRLQGVRAHPRGKLAGVDLDLVPRCPGCAGALPFGSAAPLPHLRGLAGSRQRPAGCAPDRKRRGCPRSPRRCELCRGERPPARPQRVRHRQRRPDRRPLLPTGGAGSRIRPGRGCPGRGCSGRGCPGCRAFRLSPASPSLSCARGRISACSGGDSLPGRSAGRPHGSLQLSDRG